MREAEPAGTTEPLSEAVDQLGPLREQLARNPGNPGVRNRLAILLKSTGRLDEAEAILIETLSRYPRNERARIELRDLGARQAALSSSVFGRQPAAPAPADTSAAHAPPPARTAHDIGEPSGFESLFAAPAIPSEAADSVARSGSDRVAHAPDGISLKRSGRRTEIIAAACILGVLGVLWQLSGRIPAGHLLQRHAKIALPQVAPQPTPQPAPQPAHQPAPQLANPVTIAPPPPPVAAQAPPMEPARPITPAAAPQPALPDAAPPTILVRYRQGDAGATSRGAGLAARLRAGHFAVTLQAIKASRLGRPSVDYVFAEDLPSAAAIAARLGGAPLTVRQVAQSRSETQPPGAVTITLP